MNQKKIYLVQPSLEHADIMPLPYAVSALHAYVHGNAEIMEHFEFPEYIYEKKPVSAALEALSDAYAVFFSCYVWNYEYNRELARQLARKYPDIQLVFGGHNVSINCTQAFSELPFADFLLIGEGERPFEDILLYFLGLKAKEALVNVSYLGPDGQPVCRLDSDYVSDRFASPYQLGLFDGIVEKDAHKYRFSATLETNRGCPFNCSYCDWGLNKVRIRFAPEEQILRDIRWMSEHHIVQCYGADSNFGMFERDLRFAKMFAACKRSNGYPKTFYVSFSKNSDDRVLEITSILQQVGMLQGATLSFQSLNPATLTAIGRKNLDLTFFRKKMRDYNLRGIPTYSELILGLPLETEESFKRGIATIMDCGQHSSIHIYECSLLPNSDLGQPESIRKYGIVAMKQPFRRFDLKGSEEIQEYARIVVQTSTMRKENWRACNLFSSVVLSLHFQKLFHCIALYLRQEFHLPYDAIYSGVLDSWRGDRGSEWAELVERIDAQLAEIAEGRASWLFNWPQQQIKEESFSNAITKFVLRHYDEYMERAEQFVGKFCRNPRLCKQLVQFQGFCLKTRFDRNALRSETFAYAFGPYLEAFCICESASLQEQAYTITGKEFLQSVLCR